MIVLLTVLTLIAFAANSLLCRMALSGEAGEVIDPISFTTIRLMSGAIVLFVLTRLLTRTETTAKSKGSWASGLALFAYAAAFSLAYVSLSAGVGALILFGSVQLTMLAWALRSGERLAAVQWIGLVAAFGGLVYLTLPGLTAPDPMGAALMGISGIAWGVYSIRGRGAAAPVLMTAQNFCRAAPLAVVASGIAFASMRLPMRGVLLALASGTITSGMGYVLWYRALRQLTTTQAAVVQLTVPVIAAFGGIMLLSEIPNTRLVVASVMILGGVALVVVKRGKKAPDSNR